FFIAIGKTAFLANRIDGHGGIAEHYPVLNFVTLFIQNLPENSCRLLHRITALNIERIDCRKIKFLQGDDPLRLVRNELETSCKRYFVVSVKRMHNRKLLVGFLIDVAK